jgi:hypothetical protein
MRRPWSIQCLGSFTTLAVAISRFEVADIPLIAAKRLRHQAEGGSVAAQLIR